MLTLLSGLLGGCDGISRKERQADMNFLKTPKVPGLKRYEAAHRKNFWKSILTNARPKEARDLEEKRRKLNDNGNGNNWNQNYNQNYNNQNYNQNANSNANQYGNNNYQSNGSNNYQNSNQNYNQYNANQNAGSNNYQNYNQNNANANQGNNYQNSNQNYNQNNVNANGDNSNYQSSNQNYNQNANSNGNNNYGYNNDDSSNKNDGSNWYTGNYNNKNWGNQNSNSNNNNNQNNYYSNGNNNGNNNNGNMQEYNGQYGYEQEEQSGYWDDEGNWVETAAGYWNENGEWIEYEQEQEEEEQSYYSYKNQQDKEQYVQYYDPNGFGSVYWANLGFDILSYSLKYTGCAAVQTWSDYQAQYSDTVLNTHRFALFRLCPSNKCNPYSVGGCSKNYGEYVLDMDLFLDGVVQFNRQRYWHYCHYCRRCNALESFGERMAEMEEKKQEYMEEQREYYEEMWEKQQQYDQSQQQYYEDEMANFEDENYDEAEDEDGGRRRAQQNNYNNANNAWNGNNNNNGWNGNNNNRNNNYYNNGNGNNQNNYNYQNNEGNKNNAYWYQQQDQDKYDEYGQYSEKNDENYWSVWNEEVFGEWDEDWSETWLMYNWQYLPYCSDDDLMACEYSENYCEEYEDEDYNYEDEEDARYAMCTQIDNGYYVAPHCGNDGFTISLAIYSDDSCNEYVSDISIQEVLGYDVEGDFEFFPDGECISCSEDDEERIYDKFVEANMDYDQYETYIENEFQEYIESQQQQQQYYNNAEEYYQQQKENYNYNQQDENNNRNYNWGNKYYGNNGNNGNNDVQGQEGEDAGEGQQGRYQYWYQYNKNGGGYTGNIYNNYNPNYSNSNQMQYNYWGQKEGADSFYYNRDALYSSGQYGGNEGFWYYIHDGQDKDDEDEQNQYNDDDEEEGLSGEWMQYGIADVCGVLYSYSAKCNKGLINWDGGAYSGGQNNDEEVFLSNEQITSETLVCNFIDNLQANAYNEYGEIVLSGYSGFDLSQMNWREKGAMDKARSALGITPDQVAALIVFGLATLGMAIWAIMLHTKLARKNIPWIPKAKKSVAQARPQADEGQNTFDDIDRTNSGIMLGRSRSGMSTDKNVALI